MLDCNQFNSSKGEIDMKHTTLLSLLAFVLVVALAFPSPAMAGAQRTTFTGTSSFGESINPGDM
jgi:hypothetical protein